jgi:hypothetical protein
MPKMKAADVARTASLLKRLAVKADTNKDGALRNPEITQLSPYSPRDPRSNTPNADLKSALHGAQRFALSRGEATVEAIHRAIDEIAQRVKAADRDGDGLVSEREYAALATVAAQRFVDFGEKHATAKVSDFKLEPQRETTPPRFDWRGTPGQVCSSLLNAFSEAKNDNFWPEWASPAKGASRYVLTQAEAKKMVEALEPLYASRQKSVLTELARRTLTSEFGCVSCSAGARAVFDAYAQRLGVQGLQFLSPGAPRVPAP